MHPAPRTNCPVSFANSGSTRQPFYSLPRNGVVRRWLLGCLCILGLLFNVGCNQSESTADAPGSGDTTASGVRTLSYGPGEKPDAMRLLRDMAAAYREAPAYADQGRIFLRFERGTEKIDESADFSLLWKRPNKIRIDCYQAHVVCNGQLLRATIDDLPDQVLSISAPAQLTITDLFQDPVLAGVLMGGIAGTMPQLGLLLADDPLSGILAGAEPPELLEPQSLDDHPCHRVLLKRPDGRLVLWIDQQTHALRRIDYPIDDLRKQLGDKPRVAGLRLWAEFSNARLDDDIQESAFRFAPPAEVRLVQRFEVQSVRPPEPPAPSVLLGKTIDPFTFVTLDDRNVARDDLHGKVVVLDFWATWCSPCRKSLPQLQQVYEQFRDRENVLFYAVSIDDPSVKNEELRAVLDELGVTIPVLRDPSQAARNVFHVEGIPNLFVLGPTGLVEDYEVGVNPQLAQDLPRRIERLLSGESIFAETIARYEKQRADYERSKQPQSDESRIQRVERAQIAERTTPQHLALTPLWQCREISKPGNLLLLEHQGTDSSAEPAIYVLDGWRRVVQLDGQGKIVKSYDLDIPSNAVVSSLHAGRNIDGEVYFVGTASTQPQVHVFHADWSRAFSFPESEDAEIAQAAVADLDGDDIDELYIAYWGHRGVERVDPTGKPVWRYKDLENVFSIAPSFFGNDTELLCANSRGNLVAIDASGNRSREISVSSRFIRAVYAADLDGDGRCELCGLSPTAAGNDVAVGISPDGALLWSQELPPGLHQQPIEPICAAFWPLSDQAYWLLAGADGSIHFIGADGTLVDRFHYGVELTGLSATVWNNQAVLLVATTEGVDAWKVERR